MELDKFTKQKIEKDYQWWYWINIERPQIEEEKKSYQKNNVDWNKVSF